jgi:uncharacterized protein
MDQDHRTKELLQRAHTIAIVGLSAESSKASYTVACFLQEKGFRIIPVNPGHEMILGEKCYRRLSEIPEKIDIVDIFMRSEKVLPVVEEAILVKPAAIWLQLGIVNQNAREETEKAGIVFVQDKCVKQEYVRLFS